jgi:hypothetical protein
MKLETNLFRLGRRLAFAGFVAAALGLQAQSLAPVYLIEPFQSDAILVHFDTDARRRYELQSSTNLHLFPTEAVRWTSVYVVPAVPFSNHHIVYDPQNDAPLKWYRIVVTP